MLARINTPIIVLFSVFCLLSFSYAAAEATVTVPDEIKNYNGEIKSATFQNKDNLKIYKQYWIPAGDIKAVVLLIHGTSFHSGAYDDTGKYLSAKGYVVCGTDLKGWGQSEGKHVKSYDEYVDDLKMVMEDLKAQYPEKKIFVLGENSGAIVPLYGQLKHELFFDGLIFSGAFHKPNPKMLIRMPGFAASLTRKMGKIGTSIMPKNLPAVPSDIGISMAISDKDSLAAVKKDPLVTHGLLPVSWADSLLDADAYIELNLNYVDQPTLLLHGEKDSLVPLASSEEILNKISSHDKELKIIKESGNAILLDGSKFEALENILTWLDKRC